MGHLLLTNDFPPKVGGIQSYLWELWRRLPPERVTVVTGADPTAAAFDAAQPFRVERLPDKVVVPIRKTCERARAIAADAGATFLVIDPILPLGLAGRRIGLPYGIVLHGAEAAAPARLPGTRHLMRRVLRQAELVVAAGSYAGDQARRLAPAGLDVCEVPPGVDLERFHPLAAPARAEARRRLGLRANDRVVLALSRLVPRKGFDVVIRAVGRLAKSRQDLCVVVAGAGRDRKRLENEAREAAAPVRFLGKVANSDLADLYGCADVFAMPCRARWGGLEQEGFGIVFLEAAACGTPQVAGGTGGAAEAVVDGETGVVVADPRDDRQVEAALARFLDDHAWRDKLGANARRRAEEEFDYDQLAASLDAALLAHE